MNQRKPQRDSIPIEKLNEMVRELGDRTRVLNEDAKKQSAQFRSLCEQSEALIRYARMRNRSGEFEE